MCPQEGKAEKTEVEAAVAKLKQLKIELEAVVKAATEDNQKESKARCGLKELPLSCHCSHVERRQGGFPHQACHAA